MAIWVYLGTLTFLGIHGILEGKEQMDLMKWMRDAVTEQPLGLRTQTGSCVQEGLTLSVLEKEDKTNKSRTLMGI